MAQRCRPLRACKCASHFSSPPITTAAAATLRVQRWQLSADRGEAVPAGQKLRRLLHPRRHGQPENDSQQRLARSTGRHALYKCVGGATDLCTATRAVILFLLRRPRVLRQPCYIPTTPEHWLAVDGVQPNTPQNPGMVEASAAGAFTGTIVALKQGCEGRMLKNTIARFFHLPPNAASATAAANAGPTAPGAGRPGQPKAANAQAVRGRLWFSD